jgi:O-acetyl-ADP-ribose deacetylase (regulator of RNase III)
MVIHTRGPKYHFDPEPSLYLSRAIENTLLTADREKLVRLAVPALSTGVYAYPIAEAAEVMLEAAYRTLLRLSHLREIRFVAFDKPMLEAFEDANSRRKAACE